MINEDFLREDVSQVITGEEIANMVGMGDTYRKGKAEIAHEGQMQENIVSKFKGMMNRINEVEKKNKADIID